MAKCLDRWISINSCFFNLLVLVNWQRHWECVYERQLKHFSGLLLLLLLLLLVVVVVVGFLRESFHGSIQNLEKIEDVITST